MGSALQARAGFGSWEHPTLTFRILQLRQPYLDLRRGRGHVEEDIMRFQRSCMEGDPSRMEIDDKTFGGRQQSAGRLIPAN
jgi:hypothetical protein